LPCAFRTMCEAYCSAIWAIPLKASRTGPSETRARPRYQSSPSASVDSAPGRHRASSQTSPRTRATSSGLEESWLVTWMRIVGSPEGRTISSGWPAAPRSCRAWA
jgi:hypothetical protein